MPKGVVSVEVDAPSAAAFDLIHDYTRRLEWDTMLSDARLLGGAEQAGVGVRSLCVGTWRSAFLGFDTEYIRFEPGRIAAIRLAARPPLFDQFAASIRHTPLGPARSRITYTYFFRARPAFAAPLLEPIMNALLKRETRRRLDSLFRFLATGAPNQSSHAPE